MTDATNASQWTSSVKLIRLRGRTLSDQMRRMSCAVQTAKGRPAWLQVLARDGRGRHFTMHVFLQGGTRKARVCLPWSMLREMVLKAGDVGSERRQIGTALVEKMDAIIGASATAKKTPRPMNYAGLFRLSSHGVIDDMPGAHVRDAKHNVIYDNFARLDIVAAFIEKTATKLLEDKAYATSVSAIVSDLRHMEAELGSAAWTASGHYRNFLDAHSSSLPRLGGPIYKQFSSKQGRKLHVALKTVKRLPAWKPLCPGRSKPVAATEESATSSQSD